MLRCNLTEVEMELFVVSFLSSCRAEFNPEVTLLPQIERFRCGDCARRDSERRLSEGRGGADFRHVVQRQSAQERDGVVKDRAGRDRD